MTNQDVRWRVQVDRQLCEGHALCAETAPEVFDVGPDDLATAAEHPPNALRERVDGAVAACPCQGITVIS